MTNVIDAMTDQMLATGLDVVLWPRETVEELAVAAKDAYEKVLIADLCARSEREVIEWYHHTKRRQANAS